MLNDILYKTNIRSVRGNTHIGVEGLQLDSRKVTAGSCFIAVKGTVTDGHEFIEQLIQSGVYNFVVSKKEF